MLTITFKLFTSHAPTAVPVPSHERRHICYSLNFYDDGARHGFPLTRPPPIGLGSALHYNNNNNKNKNTVKNIPCDTVGGDSVLHFDDVDLRVSFKIHINFY